VNRIENTRNITMLSYKKLCASMGVPYHRFRRWQKRMSGNQRLYTPPGPKKTEPFNFADLQGEVKDLKHGIYRTAGTKGLYGKYRFSLSRRELNNMVMFVREEKRLTERRNLTRVTWNIPGMVWATDGTKYCEPGAPAGSELQTVRDMASKYLFRPLFTTYTPSGKEVGGYWASLFHVQGVPLFMKTDNAGNFCGEDAMSALLEHGVIPIISPPEYPRYNGSIENLQADIKGAIKPLLPCDRPATEIEFEMCARVAAHDLNHKARQILKGRTACRVMGGGGQNPVKITIPERRAIYDWLNDTTGTILSQLKEKEPSAREKATARRRAAEMWLLKNNIIKLTRNGESVTLF